MDSARKPKSTRRAAKARSPKPTPKPPTGPSLPKISKKLREDVRRIAATVNREMKDTRLRDDKGIPTPDADDAEDLFAILGELVHAISVVLTAKRSLEHRDSNWDEIVTLEAAIKMLRRVDVALNDVADGRPSRIRAEDDIDNTGAAP